MFNIFFLAFFAVAFAIGLAMIATRAPQPNNSPRVPPEDDYLHRAPADPPDMSIVFDTAQRICLENGLDTVEKIPVSEDESFWVTQSTNPLFYGNYVFGFFSVSEQEGFVTLSRLLEFKDFVKSIGSTKGFYFTNGFFTRDVHQPLEGPRVSLYNARRIMDERKRLGV